MQFDQGVSIIHNDNEENIMRNDWLQSYMNEYN